MLGRLVAAMLGVAALCEWWDAAQADEVVSALPKANDITIFETSARIRQAWTEISFRGNRPKAWDQSFAPEFRASLRILTGLFEGKLEVGAAADRHAQLGFIDVDASRVDLQLGVNSGTWSYLAEWKLRDVFEPGFGDFITELDIYDLRVRKRFSAGLLDGLPNVARLVRQALATTAARPMSVAARYRA